MKYIYITALSIAFLLSPSHAISLEVMFGANVNWVGISSASGYVLQTEVEKNGEVKVYYLDLPSDGSMSDFTKTVYSTLLTAKVSGQKIQIASDNGQTYIKYVYLKED